MTNEELTIELQIADDKIGRLTEQLDKVTEENGRLKQALNGEGGYCKDCAKDADCKLHDSLLCNAFEKAKQALKGEGGK